MADLFVDTAGWGHLVDPDQPHHTQARTVYQEARRQRRTLITSNYVLTELVALMTSPLRLPRAKVIDFIDALKKAPHVEIVHVAAELDEAAWQMLRARSDKEWSLVDCASFVIMRRRGLTDALSTDHHFEQAGFVILLGS